MDMKLEVKVSCLNLLLWGFCWCFQLYHIFAVFASELVIFGGGLWGMGIREGKPNFMPLKYRGKGFVLSRSRIPNSLILLYPLRGRKGSTPSTDTPFPEAAQH